jgi:chorismate--pyruvate lyase
VKRQGRCGTLHWLPHGRLRALETPESVVHWLRDRSSLTRRLAQLCAGQVRVYPLQQSWERPLLDEARQLGLSHQELALVRQVRLGCGQAPWVFARTVFPRATLAGRHQRLGRLGTRPLGAVLFADPTLRRGAVHIACLDAGQPLFRLASRLIPSLPQTVWARRSVFYVERHVLLVTEIFLPALVEELTP